MVMTIATTKVMTTVSYSTTTDFNYAATADQNKFATTVLNNTTPTADVTLRDNGSHVPSLYMDMYKRRLSGTRHRRVAEILHPCSRLPCAQMCRTQLAPHGSRRPRINAIVVPPTYRRAMATIVALRTVLCLESLVHGMFLRVCIRA